MLRNSSHIGFGGMFFYGSDLGKGIPSFLKTWNSREKILDALKMKCLLEVEFSFDNPESDVRQSLFSEKTPLPLDQQISSDVEENLTSTITMDN